MAIHKIIYLPDPRLRLVSEPITEITDEIQTLIDDMFETLYHVRGAGLAAPQIGINKRLSVIDINNGQTRNPLVLINPEIIESKGTAVYEEGCLSVPGVWDKVTRAAWVKLRATNRHGEVYEMEGDGVLGECFQHEIDHLNGKLYVDLLSPLKRKLARSKLEKYKRLHDR